MEKEIADKTKGNNETKKSNEEVLVETHKEDIKREADETKKADEAKKTETKKTEARKAEAKKEKSSEEKPAEKKKEKPLEEKIKKTEALARGLDLHASKKHCMYICSFIKGRAIDDAIADLQKVIKLKKAVPFKGEIPHRKGMMSGRYPINASKLFTNLLKSLKGNVIENGMELERTRIYLASASWASRPSKRRGGRLKRTNVILKAREVGEVVGEAK